jgi:multidrug efflux pump subunit AcrA (membrane-fusion protein)
VKAPFDGVVTARQVSVGAFVGATTTPTLLATIVQMERIYVNFNISGQDVLRLRAEMTRRGLTRDDLQKVRVEVGLQIESGYPHVGTFDYASPIVNSQTGTLAVAQYPDVVPPTVQVTTRYPGASARTLIDTVALPIEQQVNGVDGMIYMQADAGSDDSYALTVTFAIGTDLNLAQILVQKKSTAICRS